VTGESFEVVDNRGERRFEARVEGDLAGLLYYVPRPGGLELIHTDVAEEFEGQGVGGRLVAGALDDVRERGLTVAVTCPFAAGYIERHPEYADVVAAYS
jgi:predicted GNAT family acetyltransferase